MIISNFYPQKSTNGIVSDTNEDIAWKKPGHQAIEWQNVRMLGCIKRSEKSC